MGHIRPKVRKAGGAAVGENLSAAGKEQQHQQQHVHGDEKAVEETRVRLEQWMGVGERPVVASASEKLSGSIPRHVSVGTQEHSNSTGSNGDHGGPKSILRKPKYSSSSATNKLPPASGSHQQQSSSLIQNQSSVFKEEKIVERDISRSRSKADPSNFSEQQTSAAAVEGYEPRFDHNKRLKSSAKGKVEVKEKDKNDDDAEEEPLIFNALSDMMKVAGTLPPQDGDQTPLMVEADISFSCLSADDYQKQLMLQEMSRMEAKDEEQQNARLPNWKAPISGSSSSNGIVDGYTGSNPVSEEEEAGEELDDDESDGGNGLFDMVMGDGSDDESEAGDFQPRAFRIIWECLSPLITHESVEFLRKLRIEHDTCGSSGYVLTASPTDDLAYSRSNGFLAMLRMYMTRALEELGLSKDMRRAAEQRLVGLVYTFNFSRPAGRLETPQWKALTCIMLEIVFFLDLDYGSGEGQPKLPATVRATGMTVEEYKYLAKNTIRIFDIPGAVVETLN